MAKSVGLKKLSKIKAKPTEWYWQGYIPAGALTLFEGDPGLGKSTVLAHLTACTTKRRNMPGTKQRARMGNVLWFTGEDDPSTIQRNLVANGADTNRVFVLSASDHSQITLPVGVDQLKKWIREKKAKLVIFDPAMAFISGSANDANSVRKSLTPLAAVAAETGAAIILVRHLTKGGNKNAMHQGAGSAAWSAAARAELQVVEDATSKLIDPNNSTRVLVPVKNSLGPKLASQSFRLVDTDDGVKVEWLGPSKVNSSQFGDVHLGPALRHACDVVCTFLTPSPLNVADIKRLARENGVCEKTLQRAKEHLEVKSVRHGFGSGAYYTWELPESNPLIDKFAADAADELAAWENDGDLEDTPDADDGESALLSRAGVRSPTSAEIDWIEESLLAV